MSKSNINRPEISTEEINSGKDFDKAYKQFTKVNKPFFKQKWFIANSIIAGVAIIIASVVLFNGNNENPDETDNQTSIEKTLQSGELIVEDNTLKPYVNPPIEGLNVPFTTYVVQSNKGITIKHKTGSFLKIPKNAFVNKNEELIKGKVEIKYREFKDVAEIFASGIPMTYHENGEEFHFESAGMIEILAYQDGIPVYMNPKKKIDIEMKSDYAGTHYNLYSLDTINREWVYKGKDRVITKSENLEENRTNNVSEPSLFDRIFNDGNLLVGTTPKKNLELNAIRKGINVIQKDIVKIKKTKPEKPNKATDNRFRFNLDVKKDEFPEMSVYEGLEFEIGKENKNFDPKLTHKEWHDISLAKNKNNKYILTLKRYLSTSEKGGSNNKMDTKEFIVYPVYEGQNYKVAMADFDEKFKTYSKKLNNRKEDERIKKDEYEKKMDEIKAENKRRQEEWEANATTRQNAYKTSSQIYRVFSAYKFGTLNCDSPVRWPSGQKVLASFSNELKKN